MRKLLAMLGLAAAVSLAPGHARADDWDDDAEQQQHQQVNPEVFEQNLSPYGQWDNDSTYGEVFYPNVAAGWRPYVYGRWVWTDYGWMWDSEEPFGWAVYHYGRWWFNPWRHAWGWVPGYEWAPAWVVWRFGGSAVGWAPLYVGYDAWVDNYPIYYDHWVYVPCDHFYGGPVYSYVYAPTYVRTVFYNTQPAYGYIGTVSYGPPTTYVAAHSAVPITTTQVTHSASPAGTFGNHSANSVPVYNAPGTHAYDPHVASAPQYRGPGAAHNPVTAPPSVTSRAPSFIPSAPNRGRGPGNAPNQGNGPLYNPGNDHGRGPGVAPNQGHGPNTPSSGPPGQGRQNTPSYGAPGQGRQNNPSASPPVHGDGNRPPYGNPGYGSRPSNPGFNGPGYGNPNQPNRPQQRPGQPQGPQQVRPGGNRPQTPQPQGQGGFNQPHTFNNNPSYTPMRRPEVYHAPNLPQQPSGFSRQQPSVASRSYGQPSFGGGRSNYGGSYGGGRSNYGGSFSGGRSNYGGSYSGGQPSFSAPAHRSGGSAPAPAPSHASVGRRR